jgi:CheY-like chemotaxis protein
MKARLLISAVDDDQSFREALPELLKELGFAARIFSSAEEFLVSDAGLHSSCLLLDVGMPVMSGPELLSELRRRNVRILVVFITARRTKPRDRNCLMTEQSNVCSNSLTTQHCCRRCTRRSAASKCSGAGTGAYNEHDKCDLQ